MGKPRGEREAMSEALPLEAEKYIVQGSVPDTLRALTAAAERGEFGYSVLAMYVREVEKGRDPRFAKTKPVPLRMREAIEAEPATPARQVIYRGLSNGLWTWEDVALFEANSEALSSCRTKPERRGVYLTRGRRTGRRHPDTGGQFVPKMSLDAVCDRGICDGAKACLAVLLARAGKSDTLVTYTVSIASHLGRTARTVRNHFRQLEDAGLIRRETGRHPNTVKITILAPCRPAPYVEPVDVKAFKLARRSANPVIRNMADTVVLASFNAHREQFAQLDRRKGISAFNSKSSLFGVPPDVPPQMLAAKSPPTTHSRMLERPTKPRFAPIQLPPRTAAPDPARLPDGGRQGLGKASVSSAVSSPAEKMAFR